jgi:hypothetical protein
LSWFRWVGSAPFESEKRRLRCSPPDVCMSPECTSTQVFRLKGSELYHLPRCGRRRTKWERGNVDSERPDTTVCRTWAMKKHSQNYSLLGLSAPVRRRSIDGLRGRSFLSPDCFPQLANPSSAVDLGSSLTIKARTVAIFSGHTVLFQPAHAGRRYQRILLGSIRPPRGRQSRNESGHRRDHDIPYASQ